MKNKLLALLLLLPLLLHACGRKADETSLPALPTVDATSPLPSPTQVPPTPTAELPGAESTVSAFLQAWEAGDYGTMYAWTTTSTQALVTPEDFNWRYANAMSAAGVISMTAQLRSVLQNGSEAQAVYNLVWHTALVGELRAEITMMLAFEGNHWGVVWHEGLIWPDLFGGYLMYMDYRRPARANIYDHDGLGLAVESRLVSIGVVPGQISDETALLNTLSAVTGLPPAEIQAKYAGQPADWYIAIGDVSVEAAQSYRAALETTAGLRLEEKDARYYPGGGIAPHVVGYTGLVPAEQLDAYQARGYRGDEWVGVAGLEAWGESFLSGQPGVTLRVVTPDGRTHRTLAEKELVVSRPIYTTLRRDFQLQVQEILGERTGAIVVLDANSGALLASASGPDFDPNVFIVPNANTERSILLSDAHLPLFNRVSQGKYPLGSVFKIVTMAAALEAGGYTPESTYTCTGTWAELGPGAIKTDWLEGGHGTLTLVQGLERSCDPYFYHLGLDLANQDYDILPQYARDFGLGEPTGIEGVAEAGGLVPDPAWKLQDLGEGWGVGDTVNMAIGQGFLLVTPLQVARYVAAVANGGTLYRPYVVGRVGAAADGSVEAEVFEAQVVGQLPLSEENLDALRQGLEGATQRAGGTAVHRFYNMSVPVAGKTGTAQAPGETSLPHSWFAGYAPANCHNLPDGCEMQIAVAVLIENAGEGSSVAAPLFRQVVEAFFGLPLTPLPPEALPPTPEP